MRISITLLILLLFCGKLCSQHAGLTNTDNSAYARLQSVSLHDVAWTSGFWADRFETCKNTMMPHLWDVYHNATLSHAFKNFEIAAGLDTGSHSGPPFHDGDFYKLLESVASLYAITKDERLNAMMDKVIPVIAAAQRKDGYIHTPVMIAGRKQTTKTQAFQDRLNFETYNMGHLMTAACIHYRATGKRTLLEVAIRATDFLNSFYKRSSPELARNAICPSHYMGVVEMYRTTGNKEYLALAKNLINIRGYVAQGTDDNQDRIPFRKQTVAMGHAVRANYLYAGVADVYLETGEDSLLQNLNLIWNDVVNKKMYVTGACGALYDGVSPYGISYQPVEIQKTHQSYGRAYQLPNITAHNETCANIGNVLWNWRMLQITGQAKYADIMELALYNSVLSGVSLRGNTFSYTNPLSASEKFPYALRWSGGRQGYIRLSNCCPPNAVRTVAEVSHYAYSLSADGVWLNLYGSNKLTTKLSDGSPLQLTQETDYPWNGKVTIRLENVPAKTFALFLRIPGWARSANISVNGKAKAIQARPGEYVKLTEKWSAGDVIVLDLPMQPALIEANPLVEENRNQVAVKRGPIIYCLESADLPDQKSISDIVIPSNMSLHPEKVIVDGAGVMALKGEVDWNNTPAFEGLYREVPNTRPVKIPVTFIPYFAWGNRGEGDMTVWMPYK